MMLPELMWPASSAAKLAAFTEWATPMSSAWMIRSFALAGWPSRSAIVLFWALRQDKARSDANSDEARPDERMGSPAVRVAVKFASGLGGLPGYCMRIA